MSLTRHRERAGRLGRGAVTVTVTGRQDYSWAMLANCVQ